MEISSFCEANEIHLIGLHPNATFVQQPCDTSLFHPVKVEWEKLLRRTGAVVKRTNVCTLVGQLFDNKDYSDDIRAGFRTCGLFPLDRNAIKNSKLVKPIKSPRSHLVFSKELPLYVGQNVTVSGSSAMAEQQPSGGKIFIDTTVTEMPTVTDRISNIDTEVNLTYSPSHFYSYEESSSTPTTSSHTFLGFHNEDSGLGLDDCQKGTRHVSSDNEPQRKIITCAGATMKPSISFDETSNSVSINKELVPKQKLNFTTKYEFECAAKRFSYELVKQVYGPQLVPLLESGRFQAASVNDFIIEKMYQQLKPPASVADVLTSPVQQQVFTHENFAYSSSTARQKMIRPSLAQQRKAAEVAERQQKRKEEKLKKEEQLKLEKEKKLEDKKSKTTESRRNEKNKRRKGKSERT